MAAKGSQDQSEIEAHLGAQPHLQVHDALHIGVRYAADYLVGNYVHGGQQILLPESTGEKQ